MGIRLNSRHHQQLALSLAAHLQAAESDPALREAANLRSRSIALDRLETLLFDEAPDTLHQRADTLRAEFESIDASLYSTLRESIKAGQGATTLRLYVENPDEDDTDRYDYRDDIVSGVLQFDAPEGTRGGTDPDSVFYQPTPARHFFALLRRVTFNAGDVLVDLGSGLGHVPLMVAACTPARCIGIEIEPAYVHSARRCAASLQLANVTFRCEDARLADFSTGTVFYLYTPFGGAMLRTVLDRLQREAATRPIRVASYGPCTTTLAKEPWLSHDGDPSESRLALFRSR